MAYPRFPGLMGAGLIVPVIDKGTSAKIASAVPGPVDEQSLAQLADAGTTKARAMDIEKTVAHLDKHAHSTRQGQCAKYVRMHDGIKLIGLGCHDIGTPWARDAGVINADINASAG